ncbi:MAG: N-(5'-phosphoribosyl)anthranilate isomerase [Paracoccaceae bacterium]|nr:N-(5'-phosphoribosyl)anthranilate isomerase [Paracoccaceae bacterium]
MSRGPIKPDEFFRRLFANKAAQSGAVVRRQVRDVERYFGRDAFLTELKRRGYPVIENAGQFIIFCNQEPIERVG